MYLLTANFLNVSIHIVKTIQILFEPVQIGL